MGQPTKGPRANDTIQVYRSAVIPYRGDIDLPGKTVSGTFSAVENLYITLGHEVAHRHGVDRIGNNEPHKKANALGVSQCKAAGHCEWF